MKKENTLVKDLNLKLKRELEYQIRREKETLDRVRRNYHAMVPITTAVRKALQEFPEDFFEYVDIGINYVSIKTKGEAMSTKVVHKLVRELNVAGGKFRKEMSGYNVETPSWRYAGEIGEISIEVKPSFPNPDCVPTKHEHTYTSKNWVCELPK